MKTILFVAFALVACALAGEETERVKKDALIGVPYGFGYARTVLPGVTTYSAAYPYSYSAYPYAYGAYPYNYGYNYPFAARTIVY